MFKYEAIVNRLIRAIRAATLTPGQLPPVRALSRREGVSLTTAPKTYRRREQLGLARAYARSGHRVTGCTDRGWTC
jgi:DNA-binding transcriptional regulator YhcF (GntR family)